MKKEIKEKVIKKITYYLDCPYCKKEIFGHDKVTVLRNFKKHSIKCKRKVKEKQK
jgi:DNA-directed RNA polymerase subunit RPC12/RpoP